jgi:signal transduction histidine kinase/ActR/RegA family two-component response regulator
MTLSAGLGLELARRLSGEARTRAALQAVLEATLAIPSIDACGVYRYDAAQGVLELQVHANLSEAFVARSRRYEGNDPHITVPRAGLPVFEMIDPLRASSEDLRREGIRALGVVPVLHEGQLVAVLNAASRTITAFDEATRAALMSLAALVGAAIARVTAEEALRAGEARLQLALEASGQEAWELDLERGDIVIGPIWGAALDLPIGRSRAPGGDPVATMLSRVHPDDREAFAARLEKAIATDARLESEHRALCHAGDLRWVQVVGRVTARDDDGRALRVDGTTTDVTQRHALKAKAAEGDRLSALGRLAGGLAHELNNPLAYVIANLDFSIEQISQASPALFEAVGPSLAEARIGAATVRDIVGDLRALSHVDEREGARADVVSAMRKAMNLVRSEIAARAMLDVDLQPAPLVDGAEARLSQAFLSLLLNATQAIPAGSADAQAITVRTGTDAAGRARVEVRDTGHGIAPEVLPRIFDPYFTTRAAQGASGLGLSVAHAVIATLGGEIEVESELGHGATFRVTLPPSRHGQGSTPPTSREPARTSEGPRRVLVIDDEIFIANALARMLRGHAVHVAGSADEALGQLEADPAFDVIFCDLVMPGVDGPALYERIQGRWPELSPRVVFMTGGAFTDRAREFLARVAPIVVTKPFEAATVRAVVARAPVARAG